VGHGRRRFREAEKLMERITELIMHNSDED
jgi:hypothetical protein